MLRKIFIGMACLCLGTFFLACQSDEPVPGIVTFDEDEDYPIWGYVWDGPNVVVGATVTGYDYDAPPPPSTTFGPVYTDGNGKYQFGRITDLKYRNEHMMRLYAEKGTKSGWTDYFTWDGTTARIDIYIQ
jgi:hypothetical protein